MQIIFSALNKFTWEEMDWDDDGSTSFSELIRSSDVGKREVNVEGKTCVDYFAFKDGLSIKQTSENKP